MNDRKKHRPLRVPIQTYREWDQQPESEPTERHRMFSFNESDLDADGLPVVKNGRILDRAYEVKRMISTGPEPSFFTAMMLGPAASPIRATGATAGEALYNLRAAAKEAFSL